MTELLINDENKEIYKNIFSRKVYCILGLPFDSVNLIQAADSIAFAIHNNKQLFLSTPNINFVINALSDEQFRLSVIQSDLVVVDGMPLVWIARFTGLPFSQRVAGSSLFEYLKSADLSLKSLKVFLFGGLEGVASKACRKINQENTNIKCSGWHDPGFVSVEEMSTKPVIEKINSSKADFLVLALGAVKGQAWILRNKEALDIPVISHLGAVINFSAGNIKRAPKVFQNMGLEWLWRIFQEPSLCNRYFKDGLKLVNLLAFRVIPHALNKKFTRLSHDPTFNSEVQISETTYKLYLSGSLSEQNIEDIRSTFVHCACQSIQPVLIDMKRVTYIDEAFLGQLLLLKRILNNRYIRLTLINVPVNVRRIFYWCCVEYLLESKA